MSMTMTKRGWMILGTIAVLGFAVLTYAGLNGKKPPTQQQEQRQQQQPLPQPQPKPQVADKPDKEAHFQGKVDAVDANANTLTVGGKVIYASANTKITKDNKAIKLAQVQSGDEVSGTGHQTFDGKTEADTVIVGAKEKPPTH